MGTHRPAALAYHCYRRAASLIVVGALPLSVAVLNAAPATAQQTPGHARMSQTPFEPAVVASADSAAHVDHALTVPWTSPILGAAEVESDTPVADTAHGPGATDRHGIAETSPMPDHGEADVARTQVLDDVEQSRPDQIANSALAGAAIGAAIGVAVVSPLAITSGVVGAVAGFICGIPFLPGGLVVLPVLGAAIGFGVIAAPAAAVGAAVGAGVGAIVGAVAPPTITDEQPIAPE
ncbi:hypothetical protein AB0C34_27920 [Nocardia sp. NPDC049220]|uniref:hypothetical protein n=1 Tax=Nocardia sp. NPDC049220 TaxID=3155273 RepID=UPI0033F52CBA